MIRQIPSSMHEPSDTDSPVRTQAEVNHRCCQNRKNELPYAKGSSNVRAHRPGGVYRISSALRSASERGTRIASICTGAFVLARVGLLKGMRATTHWRAAGELARLYPQTKVDADVLYVDNGKVLTSAGAAAGLDLCLHQVRRDYGASVAAHVARAAVMPLERAGGQAQFIEHQTPDTSGSMGSLMVWMERNLKQNLSLSAIACHASMSTRTLSRRFAEQIGLSPVKWLATARIRRAQILLETTPLSVEEIAAEAGFRSASVLREHFKSTVGVSPIAWRRSFTPSDSPHSD